MYNSTIGVTVMRQDCDSCGVFENCDDKGICFQCRLEEPDEQDREKEVEQAQEEESKASHTSCKAE